MGFRTADEDGHASSGQTGTYYVMAGKRHEVIAAASQVLSKLDFLFQRNGQLVEVIRAAELNQSCQTKAHRA